jgi:hypothetical protein
MLNSVLQAVIKKVKSAVKINYCTAVEQYTVHARPTADNKDSITFNVNFILTSVAR